MKINYLESVNEAFKTIHQQKDIINNKLTADDVRRQAQISFIESVGNFLKKYVLEHSNSLQLLPKTSVFIQDMQTAYSYSWSWYNLPIWGKIYDGLYNRGGDLADALHEIHRDVNPIEVVSVSSKSIHINYNLGRPFRINDYTGEYVGELRDDKAIGINCNNIYERQKAGKEITKDSLSEVFVYNLKKYLRSSLAYSGEIEKSDLDIAKFIMQADIIVDNIIIDLSKDLYVKAVITKERYDEEQEKWIKHDLFRSSEDNENDITLSEFIRESLDKIFTFVGPGKIYLKRGRDVIGEI